MISAILIGLAVWAFAMGYWGVGLILLATIALFEYQMHEIVQAAEEIEREVKKL